MLTTQDVITKANELIATNKFDEAIKLLNVAIKSNPDEEKLTGLRNLAKAKKEQHSKKMMPFFLIGVLVLFVIVVGGILWLCLYFR